MTTATLNDLAADVCIKLEVLGTTPAAFISALIATERLRRREALKAQVYRACIDEALAGPSLPINRAFFDRVAQRPDVARSGSVIESFYYEATREGAPTIAQERLNPENALQVQGLGPRYPHLHFLQPIGETRT